MDTIVGSTARLIKAVNGSDEKYKDDEADDECHEAVDSLFGKVVNIWI